MRASDWRWIGGAACALWAALAGLAIPARADGMVRAVFRMESAFFDDAYPQSVRSGAESDVAARLAETARSHFGFLDWQAGGDSATPQLILRLVDVTGGACESPPVIKLQWAAMIDGVERPLASVAHHDLYLTCDPDVPTQEPDRLVNDVVAAVTTMLANEATRRSINKQVLARVPIASTLVAHRNEMLLLPVHPARLLADRDSQMVAKFKIGPVDAAVPSDIKVRPNSEFDQQIQLLIMAINVPSVPADLPAQGAVWHDALIDILDGSFDLRVFMIEYVPSPFAGATVGDTDVVSDL